MSNILGHTELRTPIFYSSSHSLTELEKLHPIVWIGGVHGDEPEGVELAKKTQEWLESHNECYPWLCIPCLNPDGFSKKQRTNGRGVDLNRNYPSRSWSPEAKAERYNPGEFAGSEAEIQILTHLILKIKPKLVVHCHSWEPCIVATADTQLSEAQTLAEVTGYTLQNHIGYETPGSLSQWGWHDHNIPIICIEEREGVELSTVWPRFQMAVEKIFTQKKRTT